MALEYSCKDLIFKIYCDIRMMEGVYPLPAHADKTISTPMPFDDHSASRRSTGLLNHCSAAQRLPMGEISREAIIEAARAIASHMGVDTLSREYFFKESKPIAAVLPGARVWVRRMVFGKDYQAFRIRLESGQEGWIINGGNIAVSAP